jgi:retron-type reverse transcriptase
VGLFSFRRLENRSNANGRNHLDNNNGRLVGIAPAAKTPIIMRTYDNLWDELCSYDNLFLAYKKARKHKATKPYVIEFERNLEVNLLMLRSELLFHSYKPKPLVNFIIRDPKTRKISKSDFRDRIVHHALCNIIEPIFEKSFIHDSYANRAGKGTLKALQRFDAFQRKASKNNTCPCFILKADIKKYFENVDHAVLLRVIRKKVKDNRILWLIGQILRNCAGGGAMPKKACLSAT